MEEGIALLQLHPKTETEEISRYARNEKLVSFCLLGGKFEGGLSTASINW